LILKIKRENLKPKYKYNRRDFSRDEFHRFEMQSEKKCYKFDDALGVPVTE